MEPLHQSRKKLITVHHYNLWSQKDYTNTRFCPLSLSDLTQYTSFSGYLYQKFIF